MIVSWGLFALITFQFIEQSNCECGKCAEARGEGNEAVITSKLQSALSKFVEDRVREELPGLAACLKSKIRPDFVG